MCLAQTLQHRIVGRASGRVRTFIKSSHSSSSHQLNRIFPRCVSANHISLGHPVHTFTSTLGSGLCRAIFLHHVYSQINSDVTGYLSTATVLFRQSHLFAASPMTLCGVSATDPFSLSLSPNLCMNSDAPPFQPVSSDVRTSHFWDCGSPFSVTISLRFVPS